MLSTPTRGILLILVHTLLAYLLVVQHAVVFRDLTYNNNISVNVVVFTAIVFFSPRKKREKSEQQAAPRAEEIRGERSAQREQPATGPKKKLLSVKAVRSAVRYLT